MAKTLNQIQKVVLFVFIVLFPSLFTTNFANFFDLPKLFLLVLTIGLSAILWGLKGVIDGKVSLKISSLDLPLLAVVVSYVISAILKTPNKMEAFVAPGTTTILVCGFLIYYFVKNFFGHDKESYAFGLFLSGLLVALISLFAYTGLLAAIPQLSSVVKDVNFSPVGGKLPEVIYMITILPLGLAAAFVDKDKFRKMFFMLASGIIVLSSALATFQMLPGKPGTPIIVDNRTSWFVAVDALKESPLFGIGPSNYLGAFTKYLPLSYNSTDYWANRFFSASSFALTLITEVGLLGLATFGYAVYVIVKLVVKNSNVFFGSLKLETGFLFSLVMVVLSLLTLPANILILVSFFMIAALCSQDHEVTINLSATATKDGNVFASKAPSVVLFIVVLSLLSYVLTFGFKVLKSEIHYKKAIDAILSNDAKKAYDQLKLSIETNSQVDRYHATSGQLNLALARGLASKKDITDQDKNTIAQLVQQAIAEAKATVALNPQRSSNWELLARTYQSIIPFAQGADNFTIVSFNQAIALDPISPNLRIALGGVYYALGKYDDAINSFGLAVTAKPDLANAHYNLALAYNQKKDFDKSLTEMNKVLSLVKPESEDEKLAKSVIEQIQKNKTSVKSPGSSDNLTPPPTAEPPAVKPPIVLPQEATPPEAAQ